MTRHTVAAADRDEIDVSNSAVKGLVKPRRAGAALLSAGSILAALGATVFCALPFALIVLGVSGAWIINLRAFEAYVPIFALVTFGFLAGGFYLVHRKPHSSRITKVGLWTATVLLIIALGFPKLLPLFL
jgi:mercuric ion transport protein